MSLCRQMPYWIVGELVTVVRYTGATRHSADIKQLVYGICQQINLVLGVDIADIPITWRDLRPYFVRLLSTFPSDKNLVLMLVDVDRLPDDEHNAHALEWLPATLNENVKLVLATGKALPHIASARLRDSLLRYENNIVRLLPEPTATCVEVFEQMLEKDGRRLTDDQRAIIGEALHACPLPLYMRFLLADAVEWTPKTVPQLPVDVPSYVIDIFDRLERRHGAVLVTHALAYISASETGVSDAEMDDLLSLDDVVLTEVYGSRAPEVRRVPTTTWLRLKVDIGYFLRRCNCDGVSLSCWDRDEFANAVTKRFLGGVRMRRETHSLMADYFMGKWSDVPKPYSLAVTPVTSAGPRRRRLEEQAPPANIRHAALRHVPHQPLILGRRSDGVAIYNVRKLKQLPGHLLASGRLTELNEQVLFNYDWLHAKICGVSLQSALDDLALGGASAEAKLVRTALTDAQSFVEADVDSLASELSGRLLSYYSTHPNVARLVRQCDTIGPRNCGVVPAFPYHQVPGGPLKHRLECPDRPTTFCLVGASGQRRVLAKDPRRAVVSAFNVDTGERLADIVTSAGDMQPTPNGRYLVMIDGEERKAIKVHDATSGAFTGQLIPMNHVHLRPKQKYAMSRICVSDMNVCALVTTEASFVCVAALGACAMRHVIGLDGRSRLCDITPDGRYLFVNDAHQVIVYDLQTLERISSAPFSSQPREISFTRDARRALLLDESGDKKIIVMLLKEGRIEFSFKIMLGEALCDDHVRHVHASHVRDMVLVRGAENLLVYNIITEQTIRHFRRPKKLPEEIRLPRSSYAPVEFTHALFSADDRFVIAAIFRSVYVWSVDSDSELPVATLQTPLGLIDQLLVTDDDVHIVTHTGGSSAVDVWSLGSAIGRISSIDSLTAPVAEIRLPDDDSLAFVRCDGSDELGIIDMRTGKLIDLLTHESPLRSFAITNDAEYALVTLKLSRVDLVNKIWHVTGRRIIYEFGAVGAHTVALRNSVAIVAVYQEHASFHAPYYVTLFRFADGSFDEYRLEPTLPFVLSAPFVTPDDKFLVAMSAASFDERLGDFVEPTIVAVDLNGPISMRTYGNDDMRDVVRMRRILHIRPYPKAMYAILVLFTKERRPTPERRRYDHCYDFMIFDVYNGVVCELIENFLTPSTALECVVFPPDVSICVDDHSHVFDMRSGAYVKRISGAPSSPPRSLALGGRVALYARGRHLLAIRIADDHCVACVDVHADITCVHVAHDERTVVVGCRDGTLVAHVLVDVDADDVTDILLAIRSRVCRPPSALAGGGDDCRRLRHRSWDKVDACDRTPSSRPPSAAIRKGPTDREVLSKVKLLERELFVPNNLWYTNRSKACVVM